MRAPVFEKAITSVDQLDDVVIKAKLDSLCNTTKHVSFDEAIIDVLETIRLDAFESDVCVSSCFKPSTCLFVKKEAESLSEKLRRLL